jgi:predicted GNAT family acetyltransferase
MVHAQGHSGERAHAYRQIVSSIAIPAAFVACHHDGQPASLAYGAMQDGFLMIESVITASAARGRGYAYRTVATLLAWGAGQGAKIACLQVAADNAPAVALYRRLGLRSTLYRYHYRRAPQ